MPDPLPIRADTLLLADTNPRTPMLFPAFVDAIVASYCWRRRMLALSASDKLAE
jgi:hypothetical protein